MEQLDVHPSSPKASLTTDDDILESLNMRYGTEVVSRVRQLLQTEREHTETRSPRTQEACRGPTSSVQPGAIVRNHERSSTSPSVHMDGTAGSERLAVSQTPPMRPASPVDTGRRGWNSSGELQVSLQSRCRKFIITSQPSTRARPKRSPGTVVPVTGTHARTQWRPSAGIFSAVGR